MPGGRSAPAPALGSLTAYGPDARFPRPSVAEGSVLYAHVVAVDAVGNQSAMSSGPYLFDGPQTPDLVGDLAQENWVESGGKQVGQMNTANQGVQQLFAGWNGNQLRLRWQGFDLGGGGDLFFYLATGGSGTTDLHTPNGPAQTGSTSALRRRLHGAPLRRRHPHPLQRERRGVDRPTQEWAAARSGNQNDVLLAFADLGISDPANASLKVLGVAVSADAPDVWATVPDQNVGRTWNQFIDFPALGPGIVPAGGVWADTLLEVVKVAAILRLPSSWARGRRSTSP